MSWLDTDRGVEEEESQGNTFLFRLGPPTPRYAPIIPFNRINSWYPLYRPVLRNTLGRFCRWDTLSGSCRSLDLPGLSRTKFLLTLVVYFFRFFFGFAKDSAVFYVKDAEMFEFLQFLGNKGALSFPPDSAIVYKTSLER